MENYCDERGWALFDVFPMVEKGQINYSIVYPGVVKAWHRHRRQWDHWCVLHGNARIGLYDPETKKATTHYLGERRPVVLSIPPGVWHGMTPVGNEPAGLLYFVSEKYDPKDPDEERAPWDAFGYSWTVENR
jgi:dTDP-4-dehydrorhamnose 3,5-epimerase